MNNRAVIVAVAFLFATPAFPATASLPLAEIPPGKRLMVIQPHHDDHSWQYGFAGLISKMVDTGYGGVFVRVSNDEKDGGMSRGWGRNDISNYEDTLKAIAHLRLDEVISLNWRNDHMDSIPHIELRDQIILLIRKYRPDVVMSYNAWGNYDRNPDHRKVAWAVGEAVWLAGLGNVRPDHRKMDLAPHRVPYRYYSHRSDYGRGYVPNVAIELNQSHVARKAVAYRLHKIRISAGAGRSIRTRLDAEGLKIPEFDDLSDLETHERAQEFLMEWISAKRGKENGVKQAEVFYFMDEWHHLPGLKDYIVQNTVAR